MSWAYLRTGGSMIVFASAALAQDFRSESDRDMALKLSQQMDKHSLVGQGAIQTLPYDGTDPHGIHLQTFFATASDGDHTGAFVVKCNYGPGETTADALLDDPEEHLAAVTVMFHRDAGYAPASGDWFWAKYLPDGSPDRAPDGTALAGRVTGCIEYHASADGSDYLHTTNAGPE